MSTLLPMLKQFEIFLQPEMTFSATHSLEDLIME